MRYQLPNLAPIIRIFTAEFSELGTSKKVMAQLIDPRTNRSSGFSEPFRGLKVSSKSNVSVGTVLVGSDQRKYLLMDNGVSDIGSIQFTTFKCLELQEQAVRQTPTETINDTTLRSVKGYVNAGTVYFSRESLAPIEDNLRVPNDHSVCVTNTPVNIGDLLGTTLIRRVERTLGVTRFWLAGENFDV